MLKDQESGSSAGEEQETVGIFYNVAGQVGRIGDPQDFVDLIAEYLSYSEGATEGVSITPIGKTQKDLLQRIVDTTFLIESMSRMIRDSANLNLEYGTGIDYHYTDYMIATEIIEGHLKKINELAAATDKEANEPLMSLRKYGQRKAEVVA